MEKNKIGFLTATALVIANMIGTGVFTSLGFQVGALPSVSAILLLWIAGGIIALCGGLSYIELAKQFPGSGGEYHYIGSNYPVAIRSFAGIVSVFAGFTAPIALACMAFAAYLGTGFSYFSQKTLAIAILSFISLFHFINLKIGANFQLFTTGLKILVILILIGFGFSVAGTANPVTLNQWDIGLVASPSFAIALVYVSFAYSGWNACVYIFGEISDVEHTIKRAVITGTIFVIVLYALLNYIFLKLIPINKIDGVLEIGALATMYLFDGVSGRFIGMMLSFLLISTISAMVWIGPRVIARMTADTKIPFFARAGQGIPRYAIMLQYAIIVVMILSGSFKQILTYSAVLMNVCAVLSVVILLRSRLQLKWYKLICPGFFIAATIWSIYHLVNQGLKI
ncbi:APA family basic amino acid/polyamine antiporter [Pedobacter sp. UYP24]